jgi:hypothetical protein
MKTKLAALLTGVAMLGSVGFAQADTADTAALKGAEPGPVLLTDSQMNKITAGHPTRRRHTGFYIPKNWSINFLNPLGSNFYKYGPHSRKNATCITNGATRLC